MKIKVFFILLFCWTIRCGLAQTPPYLNPSLPLDARVDDLVGRMTLQEKVSQLLNGSPAIPRLQIPEYNWWSEALHGVARSGMATVFPQAIGMAATFDDSLIFRVASAISDEARAMYRAAAEKGYRTQYGGLTFWTPNINIFRDPRWGRGQETYGEDPWLTAHLGVAFVKGMQGDDPHYLKTAACAKHFAVHSGPEQLRHEFNAVASPKDLWETYLPAFHALVNAGVEAVMCAYNRTNGEACCGNTYLLQDVLRKQWGFKGHIVSDCGALDDIYRGHKLVPTETEAAALALKRGVNLNCGLTYLALPEAVKQGLVTEKQIDSALEILLKTRFKLGLFDPEDMNPYNRIPASVINSPAHRALAREVAEKSIVLLKNDGVLPLRSDLKRYFVTGPNATSIEALIGNYYGVNDQLVTILEGIAGAVKTGSQVSYRQGIMLDRPNANPARWSIGDAKGSDATIVVLGITGLLEGEEGESLASPTAGDRLDYNLPKNQIDFLKALRKNNDKPVIAVITGGSPMNLAEVHEFADAVLLVWYPGEEGGNAVADILFGKTAPSGRLPVTFPKSFDQLPAYTDYSMKGRTYRYMSSEPLYPFGFGLSYTRFTYSDLRFSKPAIKKGESGTVSAKVENSGKTDGDEMVQLYITHEEAGSDQPLYALKGFKRVHLAAGSSQTVSFDLTPEILAEINDAGASVYLPGKLRVSIGGSSPDKRNAELGATVPVAGTLMLK
ncbi:MAG TPA: glycoside hydrolase family 3 C-terminal domain-containing protein [Puia sp.]|nr:glycoside hydrolase family 3 C-terminal domain-containing protein [Puia sp.]